MGVQSTVCMRQCSRQSEPRQWLFVAVARVLDQPDCQYRLFSFFIRSFTSFLCGSTSPLDNDEEYKTIKLHKSVFVYLLGYILDVLIMCP